MPFREFLINGDVKQDWGSYFQKIETWEFFNSSMSMGCAQFHDPSEELILGEAIDSAKTFSFRWGQTDPSAAHWNHYVIYDIDVDYLPSGGANIFLYFCDHSIRMRLNSSFATFSAMSKSDVVKKIAENYQKTYSASFGNPLQYDMENPVVEDCLQETNYIQTGQKDWDFLIENSDAAVSAKSNKGDYRLFWLRGSELHYHPPDYSQSPYRTISTRGGTDLLKLKVRNFPWRRSLNGGEQTIMRGMQRDSIETFETVMNRDALVSGGFVNVGKRDFSKLSDPSSVAGSFPGIYRASVSPYKGLVAMMTLDTFFKQFNRTFDAEMRLIEDPNLVCGQLIYLSSPNPKGQANNAEGLWLVEEIYRDISKGASGFMNVRLSRSLTTKGSDKLENVKLNDAAPSANGTSILSGSNIVKSGATGIRKIAQKLPSK